MAFLLKQSIEQYYYIEAAVKGFGELPKEYIKYIRLALARILLAQANEIKVIQESVYQVYIEREREYKKARTSFLINLDSKLNARDYEYITNIISLLIKIQKFKNKYFSITYARSNRTITAFTSWEIDLKLSLSNNLIKLFKL